jgi:nucleotide-binding universal stress UspA family protein
MLEWRRICCPVDFSDASREAMYAAAELAQRFDAELQLVHVYQMPGVSFPEATVFAGHEALQQLIELVERALSEWGAEARARGASKVTTHAIMGVPYAEVLKYAEDRQSDLIVMGTHGRTALMRALLGSVAEKVVRHAPCPVLTIRPRPGKQPKAEASPPPA